MSVPNIARRSGNVNLRNRVPQWPMGEGEMHFKDPQGEVETQKKLESFIHYTFHSFCNVPLLCLCFTILYHTTWVKLVLQVFRNIL